MPPHRLPSLTYNLLILACILLYIALFYFLGAENMYLGYTLVLGVLSFPFLIKVAEPKFDPFYLCGTIAFALLSFWSGSFSMFYFTFAFGLCFMISKFYGQVNFLPISLLLIVSPLLSHLSAILSFPIRLKLSEWVASCLSTIGFDIYSEGNVLFLSGVRFLVDQECVGLNMLLLGMVLILILMAYFEKTHQYKLWQIMVALAAGFILNILANFSRILVLVLFQIGPEKIMHDLVGISCLLLYNILPLVFLIKRWTPIGKAVRPIKASAHVDIKNFVAVIFVAGLMIFASWSNEHRNIIVDSEIQNTLLDDLEKEELDDKILKYTSPDLLVYVKPPVSPFRGSHDPRFCWRGSGYQLKLIKEEVKSQQSIYTGELVKGNDKLYTAWWYQDGNSITNSEWSWRKNDLLASKSYALVNISAESKEKLDEAVKKYLAAL